MILIEIIYKYLLKRYLKRINNIIKEYEKEFKWQYNNKETNLKNSAKSNKNIIFRDMLESGSSFMQDVFNRNLKYVIDIYKIRYLVQADLTLSQFSFMNKKRIEIEKEAVFFLLANGKHSIAGDTLLSEIYEKHRDLKLDFFILYIQV